MSNRNGGYRSHLRYWLTYIIGLIAILAIIVVGCFYMAKPYLDSFVKQEIARRSIKAETSEVSIIGKVNLTNVTLPVPAGVSLKIGAISGRPPISLIPGTFTLYNVDLKYHNIHLRIPEISLNSVFLKEKDRTIASHLLQSIMRIELASIVAPDIQLSVQNTNNQIEKFEVKNFQLSDFKNGHIHSVSMENIDLKMLTTNGAKKTHFTTTSDSIKAHDIDINYAYSIILGKNNPIHKERNVIGPVSLKKVMINVLEKGGKNASFSLGSFKTSGLKMEPFKQMPGQLIKTYLQAKKAENQKDKKITQRDTLMNNLLHMTLVDAEADNLTVKTPQFEVTFESFHFKQSLWQHPIPKKLLISFNNLAFLPKKMEEKDLELLKQMGVERLDLSEKINITYDERKHVLSHNLSFDIKNVGSGKISAKVVDVDERLFSAQKDLMTAVSQNFGISEVHILYTDAGFIDKSFSYLAQNLNDKKHDLKKELYDDFYLMMTQSPKIFLKNHAEAEKISKSLGEFAKNPQTLIIKMRAKDNKGITMADFESALQNNLSTVLNKIHLTIKNEASP
ncbi:hypothetical protein [Bartonella silvatica]